MAEATAEEAGTSGHQQAPVEASQAAEALVPEMATAEEVKAEVDTGVVE